MTRQELIDALKQIKSLAIEERATRNAAGVLATLIAALIQGTDRQLLELVVENFAKPGLGRYDN